MSLHSHHAARRVAFGCGPRAGLMISDDVALQRATVGAALDAGIRVFDTAPLYGSGESERTLGRVLADLGAVAEALVITKIDASAPDVSSGEVRASVEESLERLGVERLHGLLLHNRLVASASVPRRSDPPGPVLTADEFLASGGVLDGMVGALRDGLVSHVGISAFGSDEGAIEAALSACDELTVVSLESNLLQPGSRSEAFAGKLLVGLRPLAAGRLVADSDLDGDDARLRRALLAVCGRHGCGLEELAWYACAGAAEAPDVTVGGFRRPADVQTALAWTADPDRFTSVMAEAQDVVATCRQLVGA